MLTCFTGTCLNILLFSLIDKWEPTSLFINNLHKQFTDLAQHLYNNLTTLCNNRVNSSLYNTWYHIQYIAVFLIAYISTSRQGLTQVGGCNKVWIVAHEWSDRVRKAHAGVRPLLIILTLMQTRTLNCKVCGNSWTRAAFGYLMAGKWSQFTLWFSPLLIRFYTHIQGSRGHLFSKPVPCELGMNHHES